MIEEKSGISDDFESYMKKRAERVLEKFAQVAISGITDSKLISIVRDVQKYWKDNFRPAFASLCCEAVGGQPEAADDISLMITLASVGGGIHDDLIDKSHSKHFRWTILGSYGFDYALLVGDLFILKGWMMIQNLVSKNYSNEKLEEIIGAFGKWTVDVCEAEFREISCRKNLNTEVEDYEEILRKSMADVEACAKLGAIIGSGSKKEIESLAKIGGCIGFLYRLSNEMTDIYDKELDLQHRLNFESVPLPILYASQHGEKSQIERLINKPSIEKGDLTKLVELCVRTGALDYVLIRSKEEKKKATKLLADLQPSKAKSMLRSIIDQRLSILSKSVESNL